MLEAELEARIRDLEINLAGKSLIETVKPRAILDTLYWLKKERSKEEIRNRIKRYQEEALILNPNSEEYKALSARVEVLNSVL